MRSHIFVRHGSTSHVQPNSKVRDLTFLGPLHRLDGALWNNTRRASTISARWTQSQSGSQSGAMSIPKSANRIHILGLGNIGKLFAHALATKEPAPPLTLLLHKPSLLGEWERAGRTIEIVTDGSGDKDGAYDVEILPTADEAWTGRAASIESHIENLIVSTKATKTVTAIASIRHRLTSNSTILFTQNGMGTADEVSKTVFSDLATRPKYLACVTSHGVYSAGPFVSVHAGFGNVALGSVGVIQNEGSGLINPSYLSKEIASAPLLTAREVAPEELTRLQLEKLVINAMINPLTVLFNCRNGELFQNPRIGRLMQLLLGEASHVVRSLPELQQDPNAQERFSATRLASIVLEVAEKTGKNTSSMLQDVRGGRETEISYINGYIVTRGVELGIDCNNNEKLVQMVKRNCVIIDREIELYFPDYLRSV